MTQKSTPTQGNDPSAQDVSAEDGSGELVAEFDGSEAAEAEDSFAAENGVEEAEPEATAEISAATVVDPATIPGIPAVPPAGMVTAGVGIVGAQTQWKPNGAPLSTEPAREKVEVEEELSNERNAVDIGAPGVSERRTKAAGPEAASSLTADRLLEKTAAAPVSGWRRWLYQATFGFVNLGDSDRVRIQRVLEHRIAVRLGEQTRYVPVLSRKGGVGKTTVTTLLGMVLADLREDRVIAMDANPDRGTLSDRSPGRADFTARHLVKERFNVNSFTQLSNYTAREGSRLDVLASDTDPTVAHAFDDADYRAVTDILGRYYSIVLTDSGTGMVHSVMKGTLEKADAVVLVSGGSVDEARLASETLSWLEAHGREDLVRKATVVINMSAGVGTRVNVNEIEDHFRSRVKNVVRIPYDKHLAEGSRIELAKLAPATRSAAVELAALVVDELVDD
ncbi:MinD/ParA family ATP-binding protein [Pseudarthrobacter sp. J1738]|uniref:MinD/ParA family ATP-binding protein n=1 Tax=Pseudarthrobacter sp. J1738 TaxID=3420446 RepID=UPI003D276C1B